MGNFDGFLTIADHNEYTHTGRMHAMAQEKCEQNHWPPAMHRVTTRDHIHVVWSNNTQFTRKRKQCHQRY
jgi:hypothetical protein